MARRQIGGQKVSRQCSDAVAQIIMAFSNVFIDKLGQAEGYEHKLSRLQGR